MGSVGIGHIAVGLVVALAFLTVSCGGRVSRPIAATTPYDDQLSCDHLRAERQVNDARIADLNGERDHSAVTNVGWLVYLPLFMDVSKSEATEITAFQDRNTVLDGLIAKKCSPAAAKGD